ncbi:hypothetical protein RND81_01G071800 [Saponaria officinalis]|uniref:Pentatricopeptide repeat-containing protein n=1 Tax=Saponaria officinalis TaxID=3572 RepID=A0AAW1NGX8_SAPOF
MRSVVITTGSSSTIVTTKHHRQHHHFYHPKHHHPFLSPHNLLYLSLSKPTSPPPPSSSSSSTTTSAALVSPHLSTNSLNSYAETGSKLVEEGRFEEFKLILESVISSEKLGFGELLNSKLLVCGIIKGMKEGRIKGVVGLFECFSQLGIDVLRVFDASAMELLKRECCSMVIQGFLEDAVHLMEVLAGLQFSVKDLVRPSDFIRMLVTKRSPYLAVRYACLLPHSEVVFCTMIREFGKRADLSSAIKVFEASKQKLTTHNMYLYRTMIDVCGLCGNSFKSRLIYKDLLNQKVTPNIFVFNSLMNVNSHDLTYTMEDFAVAADMTTYNILLKACCLSERVDLAQDIYAEVQRLESTGALKLDVFTYSTIIKVFADAKLWQMAIKIKEDMLSAGVTPNTVTWSSLISACANAGLVDQAIQVFEEMLLSGCEPNSLCFNTLLHACVEGCQYDRAFRLFNAWKSSSSSDKLANNSSADMITSKIQPVDKDCLAIQPSSGTATHHLSFAKSISFKPTTATYNILLKACGTDFYRAKELIDEMKASNLSPNQISWSILIDICGASGNVKGALESLLTKGHGFKPHRPHFYVELAPGIRRPAIASGVLEDINRSWAPTFTSKFWLRWSLDMILKTMRETGTIPDVIAYTTAIKVCVESKYLKTAFSLFAEMKRNRIEPNLVTYNTLLRARSKYGSLQEIQQCLAIYQDMRKAGYKSNDYYLKLLIEKWCEGVLQNKNQKREYKLRDRADIGGLRSLLLDRVATHLQKNTTESLVVDIQGLTKVEARLVVLAVLRMIKENYVSGRAVLDDFVVILGIPKMEEEYTVKVAITKLLKKELGLEVLPVNPSVTTELLASSVDTSAPARRPALLQRLVVTKKSLNFWLTRKLNPVSVH